MILRMDTKASVDITVYCYRHDFRNLYCIQKKPSKCVNKPSAVFQKKGQKTFKNLSYIPCKKTESPETTKTITEYYDLEMYRNFRCQQTIINQLCPVLLAAPRSSYPQSHFQSLQFAQFAEPVRQVLTLQHNRMVLSGLPKLVVQPHIFADCAARAALAAYSISNCRK